MLIFGKRCSTPLNLNNKISLQTTQQDYNGRRCSILLQSYCTGTNTEVKRCSFEVAVLLHGTMGTMEYLRSYSVEV